MAEVRATVLELKAATKKASELMKASNPDTVKIKENIETISELFFSTPGRSIKRRSIKCTRKSLAPRFHEGARRDVF